MSWLVLQDSVHTQMYHSAEQLHCQSYSTISHHKLYTATTPCSRRSIFSSFSYIFVWPCEFSTKSHSFTCFCPSLEFATSMPWAYKARLCSNASHGRTPHLHRIDLRQNSLSFEKIQWLKQTSSSGTQSSCTATPSPYAPPQRVSLGSLPGQLRSLSTEGTAKPEHLNFRIPRGKVWQTQVGAVRAQEKQLLGACPAPSFYLF